MSNRDQPVNGKRSKLSLLKNSNLILTDAGKFTVWARNTFSLSFVQSFLFSTGNLVLCNMEGVILWESFDFSTNTLLPHQLLTRNTKLVSSRSQTNYSYGFYELIFDNDNLLRLLFNDPDVSSTFWPDPWLEMFLPSGVQDDDWGYGCEPEFDLSCNKNESIFQLLSTVEFHGYDFGFFPNYTFDQCTNLCLEAFNCKAFQYTYHEDTGSSNCYPKTLLLNGYCSSDFKGDIYLKLPKNKYNSYINHAEEYSLVCSNEGVEIEHQRLVTWVREKKNREVANWIEDIIDPTVEDRYDMVKMKILVEMALQCVEEDKDARPNMSQVVEMLLYSKNDHH
uniref:Uncharacterized protein n=1 Tax=Quercus lobata TaxID=97700 RepID=A0A7N2KRS9_QUELO